MRVNRFVMRGRASAHANMIRQIFDPDDLRAAVANWEEVAGELIRHLHDEVAAAPSDAAARELLEEVLAYPGVPARWRMRDLDIGTGAAADHGAAPRRPASCASSPPSRPSARRAT